MIGRPSEAIQAAVGTIVGAVLVIVGWGTDIEIPAEVVGAITILLSYLAALVTWWVARRQRQHELVSAADGSVSEA